MVTRLIALAGVLLFAWSAFSQLPTPSNGKGQGSQQTRDAQPASQQSATDPRGTNVSPLVVQVQPVLKPEAEVAEEQRQRKEDATAKRWTQGLSVLTALIGLLQLVMIGFQVRIASRQNQIIDAQNNILRDQSQSMATGLSVARVSADAAEASARAANVAVIMTHRPKIIIRDVETPLAEIWHKLWQENQSDPTKQTPSAAMAMVGDNAGVHQFGGSIRVMNVGTTAAFIETCDVHTLITRNLPLRNPAQDFGGIQDPELKPGVSRRVTIPQTRVEISDRVEILLQTKYFYVVGMIVYKDALGNSRRTGFARKLEISTGRFSFQPDTVYEYQD